MLWATVVTDRFSRLFNDEEIKFSMANKLENINRDLNNHKSTSTTNIACLEITEFNKNRANQEKTNLAK